MRTVVSKKINRNQSFTVNFSDPFFDGEIVLKKFSDRIEFRKPDIDSDKIYRTKKRNGNTYQVGITSEHLQQGVFDTEIINEDLRILKL